MKIEIISKGKSKLTLVKLIREYSGMSLKDCNDMANSLPASFICNAPYEKMSEIITEFEKAGAKINIETGHKKERKTQGINYLRKAFFGSGKESAQKQQLNSRIDVINYLKKRQNFGKAVGSGILSSIILIVMLTVFYWQSSNFYIPYVSHWVTNIIVASIIGYSIRKKGRGVEKKFGILAASLTFITAIIAAFFSYAIFLTKADYEFNMIFQFRLLSNVRFMMSISIAAVMAYFIAYEMITQTNYTNKKHKLLEKNGISELIDEKKSEMKNNIIQKPKYTKENKKRKDKRSKNVIPDK